MGAPQRAVLHAQLGVGGQQGGVGGGQLLVQGLHLAPGLHLLAPVGGHNGEARNPAVGLAQGVVHEVPVHGVTAALAVDEQRLLGGHVGRAGGQHPIQQLLKAQAGGLGQQLEQGRAQGLRRGAAPQGADNRVGLLHHIARPPKHSQGHRGLLKQLALLLLQGFALLHLRGYFVGEGGDAHDDPVFAVGLVGEGEVRLAGGVTVAGGQGQGSLVAEVRDARLVHPIEQGHKAGGYGFGQGLGHGVAHKPTVGEERLVRRVHILVAVLRPALHADGGRCVLQHLVHGFVPNGGWQRRAGGQ